MHKYWTVQHTKVNHYSTKLVTTKYRRFVDIPGSSCSKLKRMHVLQNKFCIHAVSDNTPNLIHLEMCFVYDR